MEQWLPTITTAVNLVAMVVSLWLGLYLVTRSWRALISWLAALMVWSVGSLFLYVALRASMPAGGVQGVWLDWLSQGVKFAPPLLLNLAYLLRCQAGEPRRWERILNLTAISLGYIIVSYQAIDALRWSALHPTPLVVTTRFDVQVSGPSYALFFGVVIVLPLLAMMDLARARQELQSPLLRRRMEHLLLATVIAYIGGAFAALASMVHLPLIRFPADAVLGASVAYLAYTVAKYDALIEGRPIERDALYGTIGGLTVAIVYSLVGMALYLAGQVLFLAMVLVLVCAIITHALYDAGRALLDRLFYRGRIRQLRADLRELATEAGTNRSLDEQLTRILKTVRQRFEIRRGFVAVRQGDHFAIVAEEEMGGKELRFAPAVLAATGPTKLSQRSETGLAGMAVLVPIGAFDDQLGALVLGPKENSHVYRTEELAYLDALAGQIATLILAARLQDAHAQQLDQMLDSYRTQTRALQIQVQSILAERAPAAQLPPIEIADKDVELALRNLHDYSFLGEQRLAELRIVDMQLAGVQIGGLPAAATHVERGKALQHVIIEAVNLLRPQGAPPSTTAVPGREWHAYLILYGSYVEDELTRDTMARLYIGEGTFNRARKQAIHSVARSLQEMERSASI